MRGSHEDSVSPGLPGEGEAWDYLDMQGAIGISKHMGGHFSSHELHRLCNLIQADEVLEVGCGIGVGPVTIVQRFGCRVVAVDNSPSMLHWARLRAEAAGVADRVELVEADLLELPFEDDRFDAVIAESVLSFVQDKAGAIAELRRVLKPGGWLGLNETWWPSEESIHEGVDEDIGSFIITAEQWGALWAASGLDAREIVPFTVEMRQETRDRIQWVGWPNVLAAWRRLAKLWVQQPGFRKVVKTTVQSPSRWTGDLGYGLLVGRKPAG